MNWILKKFDDLTVHELYAILQLRNEVFAIEQNCVYPDLDNKDQSSWHLMCFENNRLVACTRLLPPGIAYPEPSIGRVVTSMAVRRTGLGKELLQKSIDCCENIFGKLPITLGAQLYLKKFYESFGFVGSGEVYLEDGIEHIKMTRKASS
jgi:ElaA protein